MLYAHSGVVDKEERVGLDLSARADEIRRWSEAMAGPVDLRLVETEDPRSGRMKRFLKELVRLAPAVRLSEEPGEPGSLPGFRIRDAWEYNAVPEGRELDPFLELLGRIASGDPGLGSALRASLEAVSAPLTIELYVAVQCPNCPEVVRRIAPFPMVNPALRVRVLDAALFQEVAEQKAIRAVPTVLCGDGFRFTGQVAQGEVADALMRRDAASLGPAPLARMIKAGDAGGLAAMMLERQELFLGFLDLLAGDELSLRLGAMVAAEELGERDPALAGRMLQALWERLPEAGHASKGDIVWLIGRLGDSSWTPRLQALIEEDPHEELREALEEALENLAGP